VTDSAIRAQELLTRIEWHISLVEDLAAVAADVRLLERLGTLELA
jgi:hypothetical protein